MTALAAALVDAKAILLDFDGPVCAVFSDLRNTEVSDRLRARYAQLGIPVPGDLAEGPHIFDLFRHAASISPDAGRSIEAALTAFELEAVESAAATPYSEAVIRACHDSGRLLAIVSNNSAQAVRHYIELHEYASAVDLATGRSSADPAQLKPDPYLIGQAIAGLGVDAASAVLVGDSATDIQAARAARVRSIGYANKPGKFGRLTAARADALITDMHQLADALISAEA
jgi:phosphoglycolate phosphatase